VRYNLQFPNRAGKYIESWVGDGRFSDFGRLAEDAGFDGVSVYDHPFPADTWLDVGGHISFDPFVSLAVIAEATERIRLLTNILVIPYRSPYVTAQAFATLDRLSGGRTIAGVAAGYLEQEFRVLGAPFHGRGARVDDAIAAMRAGWTGASVDRDGEYAAHGHTMYPTPIQQPMPIWVGGNSDRAMRRAVELGDGWLPISQDEAEAAISKTPPLATFERLRERIATIQARRADLGRAPLDVCFAPFERHTKDWRESAVALRQNLAAYEGAGVTWLTIVATARSLDQLRDDVARFADIVITNDESR
jgi:probable F420-dependent oxidoreductase